MKKTITFLLLFTYFVANAGDVRISAKSTLFKTETKIDSDSNWLDGFCYWVKNKLDVLDS